MKYMLKTEINENGNKVFSKERRGKAFVYLAKDEAGAVGVVDKDWILKNKANIVNLAVSGDTLYVVDNLKKQKKTAFDLAKEAAEIVKGYYSITAQYNNDMTPDFSNGPEFESIMGRTGYGREIYHNFEKTNGFDIEAVDKVYREIDMEWDPDEEIYYVIEGVRDSSGVCEVREAIEDCDEYQANVKEMYQELRPYYKAWQALCAKYGSEKVINTLEKEFSIQELV